MIEAKHDKQNDDDKLCNEAHKFDFVLQTVKMH